MSQEIKIHPAANVFPMMDDVAYQDLLNDIRENSVRDTLVFRGESWGTAELVDGRNRLKAIQELGLNYLDHAIIIHPEDMPDPFSFVLSLNLHRRHLNESQRSMVAAEMVALKNSGDQNGKVQICTITIDHAAEQMAVSTRSAKAGVKVRKHGTPELKAAVMDKKIAVSVAAKIADLDDSEQAGAIADELAKPKRRKSKPVDPVVEPVPSEPIPEHEQDGEPGEPQNIFDQVRERVDAVRQLSNAHPSSPQLFIQSLQRLTYDIADASHVEVKPPERISLIDGKTTSRGSVPQLPPDTPEPENIGWVDLQKLTLQRVRKYCYRNPSACDVVLKDMAVLASLLKEYKSNATKARKAAKQNLAFQRSVVGDEMPPDTQKRRDEEFRRQFEGITPLPDSSDPVQPPVKSRRARKAARVKATVEKPARKRRAPKPKADPGTFTFPEESETVVG